MRLPARVQGDLRAQLAACHIAERQFFDLVARYSADGVAAMMQEVIDYAERLTRTAIRDLPDGSFSFEDFLDDDGIDLDRPIRLFVTLHKHGDTMVADWTGTSPQVKGAINNTLSFTKAASYTAIRSVLPEGIPNNEGVFRAIEVKAPAGTIANAVLPAACAARGLTGLRMTDCCFGALAMMLPDRVPAASDGGATCITIGGYHADRRPFIYVDFTSGTWGGRPWADGLEGNAHLFANLASHSVEVTEAEQPIQILGYEYMPDRGGPGKVSRRSAVLSRIPVPRGRGDPAGALRPPPSPLVRALRRPAGQAVAQRDQPGIGKPHPAEQVHDDDQARRHFPP